MDQKQQDFYQAMRESINDFIHSEKARNYKWTEYLLLVPDMFHLLVKLSLDREVPVKAKAKLAIAIAYFFSPFDLVPEAILGPIGLIDDLAVSAYALNSILNTIDPEIVKRHWAGEEDILQKVQEIVQKADDMMGSGLVKKIRNMMGDR